ncbi:hypothetical protein ACVOMV_27375 (plasmid) [Mesorhizobium atlanticum]|uniref:hypothetical protein n=1 Tax=Mesorhizobium atlanticum TaxID=2233532 RepID=UPI003704522A
MSKFTVESTYHLPAYRHRTYDAATPADACRQAIEDDDWSAEKFDYEAAGEAYITGIWSGADAAYRAESVAVPSQFHGTIQRKADHFQELFDQLAYAAPNRWACRLSTSIVGCRGQLSRLRRQKRSLRYAATPVSRQSSQGHEQHHRTRFRGSNHQLTDEGLLAADVSNAAHVANLVRRDV